MKRREFLKTAGIGLSTTAIAKPAIAQSSPEIRWRLASSFPETVGAWYAGEMFSKFLAEATDNRFQIQTFAAGEIVPGLQALDAVQNGTVELCHTAVRCLPRLAFRW
jgi:TRAP-type mannitol/chloroaromatic compound transport system substrate-binding protein